ATHKGFGLLRVRVLGLEELAAKYGADSKVAILHTAAQTLRHSMDPESFFGRCNETEFLALVQSTSPIKVGLMAESLEQLLNTSEITWWGDRFVVQAEMGCIVARPGDSLESLLSRMQSLHPHNAARAAGAGGSSESKASRG